MQLTLVNIYNKLLIDGGIRESELSKSSSAINTKLVGSFRAC